jgi:hypothetical protein
MKSIFGVVMLVVLMGSTACNRGSGCPATEAMQKTASMSPGDMMNAQKKKSKDAGPKSSVLPAEVKYKGKKKSKKGCK